MDRPFTRAELQEDLSTFVTSQLRQYLDDSLREVLRIELKRFREASSNAIDDEIRKSLFSSVNTDASKQALKRKGTAGTLGAARFMRGRTRAMGIDSGDDVTQLISHVSVGGKKGLPLGIRTDNSYWSDARENASVASQVARALSFDSDAHPDRTMYSAVVPDEPGSQKIRPMKFRENSIPAYENTNESSLSPIEDTGVHPSPRAEGHSAFALVNDHRFSLLSGIMVVLNALCVGLDTNYRSQYNGQPWIAMAICESIFCIFFTWEVAMRICAQRSLYFCGPTWAWNIFDLLIVSMQLIEQIVMLLQNLPGTRENFAILRMLRLVRAVRLVRVLHLFDELQQIVGSMMSSFGVLMWSLVVLFMVIYLFSVMLLQVVVDAGQTPHHHHVKRWFGSLTRTIFTMFEAIVGGVSWDEVVRPLVSDVSPMLGFFFSLYIAAVMFAIMNMLTGVFVDRAMTYVRDAKDRKLASQIRDLFFTNERGNCDTSLDWDDFSEKVQSEAMRLYLEELDVDASEAEGLFDLLDMDDSGSLSPKEIVDGCLRLRGPAKALDVALLMREVGSIKDLVANLVASVIAKRTESPLARRTPDFA